MELNVQPAGKTISTSPGCNLLACLIENKVPISYSCQDGRCGMCACQLLDGLVMEAGKRSTEVPTSPRDVILACQTVLTEDCAVSIPDPESAVSHRARTIRARVERVEKLSRNVRKISLEPLTEFSFSPGQHVELEFAKGLVRRYSMAGISSDPDLQIHIDLSVGGATSLHVAESLRIGDTLKLRGPLGSTFLRHRSTEPVICVAAGVGLSAVLSILRGMIQTGFMNPTLIGLGVSIESELYGVEELNDLVSILPNARRHLMVAFGKVRLPGARRGLLTDWIRSNCGDLSGWRAYAFGSFSAVESAARLLRQKGLPSSRLHVETYYPMSGR